MVFGVVDAFAQGVSPPKAGAIVVEREPVRLIVQPLKAAVTGTFTAPRPGLYQFALHGAGGRGASDGGDGGPGGLAIRTVRLAGGQDVAYAVSGGYLDTPSTSSVTFTDRTMAVTAGGDGSRDEEESPAERDGAGGVASGGDTNVDGVEAASQAASSGAFTGGLRPSGNDDPASVPGGPGKRSTSAIGRRGAPGRLVVTFVSP